MTKKQGKEDKSVAKVRTRRSSVNNNHTLKVTQIKSPIGRQEYQKKTLIGLGLNKLNRVALLEDTDSIRGMITKVEHLIKIEKL